MTPQELALHSWRQDKLNYERSANKVIIDLCDSLQTLPSPSFQSKLEELKQYLRYNYTYDEEENFIDVYVHLIAGKKNISVMELSNRLVEQVGGNTKFWQTKITDIAQYVHYHPQLAIWQVNNFYQKYLGLAPQSFNHLRKKKSLAKKYLSHITSICKLIDKSKPFEEDLVKIDQTYIKLKKASQEYYAFLDQTQNRMAQNMSSKTILNAKKNLFLFIKPKQQKMNTLMNYNFKCRRSHDKEISKLLKQEQYQQFEKIITKLNSQRKSQKFTVTTRQAKKVQASSVQQLRNQFKNPNKSQKQTVNEVFSQHPIFIWSKQYFFSYWGYIIKSTCHFNYTRPFQKYAQINYQIDSQQQFDQFHAQDVDLNNTSSQASIQQDQNSFLVSDFHQSDRQEQNRMKALTENYFKDRWVKTTAQFGDYQIIGFQNEPLPIEEVAFCQQFADRINGMSRNQIIQCISQQNPTFSKTKLEFFLRTKFKKQRSKNKYIYIKLGSESKSKTSISQNQSANEVYEISISYASKPQISEANQSDQTNLQESQTKNQLQP